VRKTAKGGLHPRSGSTRGQALVEFALILPILLLVVGGIIQFGILFWGQNTLTQVARDTGRWAATQQSCTNSAAVVGEANLIAQQSSLVGYSSSSPWTGTDVAVSWQDTNGTDPATAPCPPITNVDVRWVTVTIDHTAPVFFPWIPGNGNLHTSAQFRMEPVSQQ
jgi:Flp pilus assembly protein TadG